MDNSTLTSKMSGGTINEYISFFSQLYHFLAYSIKKPKMQLEKGMLIISIDVDVGSRELGVLNKEKNDENIVRICILVFFIYQFGDFETKKVLETGADLIKCARK